MRSENNEIRTNCSHCWCGRIGHRSFPGNNVLQLQAQAAKRALDDAGFTKDDVEALFTTANWANFPQLMLGEYLGIQPKYTGGTNIGGASFESHVAHALAGIQAGLFDVALITYGSTPRTSGSRPSAIWFNVKL